MMPVVDTLLVSIPWLLPTRVLDEKQPFRGRGIRGDAVAGPDWAKTGVALI